MIEETRGSAPDPELAAALLAEKALEADIGRFVKVDELREFLTRVAFAAEHSDIQPLGDEDVRAALREACNGKRSFAELERADVLAILKARAPNLHKLEQVAPAQLRLNGGRRVKVHYEPGQPPWIASRLQDFFGMRETPRIGGAPVVAHLLAPNNRPVQMTSDLAGFWNRLYPQVRRELCRRYPKHSWPEKPVGDDRTPRNGNTSARPAHNRMLPWDFCMAEEKLQVIPLGGLGEFGMNSMAFRYGDDIIVVDAGMMFPDAELLGVDIVTPDFAYLEQNREHVRALVLTHGHEDHIGAVPFLLSQMNIPVYGTAFTLALVERRLARARTG